MTEIKFTVPDALFKKMKKYPEIDWDSIILSTVENYIENLEITIYSYSTRYKK